MCNGVIGGIISKKILSDRALICEELPYINGSHAYSVLVCNDMF